MDAKILIVINGNNADYIKGFLTGYIDQKEERNFGSKLIRLEYPDYDTAIVALKKCYNCIVSDGESADYCDGCDSLNYDGTKVYVSVE